MAANTQRPKLRREIEGRGCPIQETRLHETGKTKYEKARAKTDWVIQDRGASKGGKNRKITGSIFHRRAVVKVEKEDIRQSETRSNCKQHLKRAKGDQQKGGAYVTEWDGHDPVSVYWKLGDEKGNPKPVDPSSPPSVSTLNSSCSVPLSRRGWLAGLEAIAGSSGRCHETGLSRVEVVTRRAVRTLVVLLRWAGMRVMR